MTERALVVLIRIGMALGLLFVFVITAPIWVMLLILSALSRPQR